VLQSELTECTRRQFVIGGVFSAFTAYATILNLPLPAFAATDSFTGDEIFQRILSHAKSGKWKSLPIGELMGKIAKEFEGTPYVGRTLEHSIDVEQCTVNMTGLDCVTFFETTLDFARMLKKGGDTTAALLNEVRFTRYRAGKQGDYSSRLHYTTDWFVDNQTKGVVKILGDLPGAEPFEKKVGFMSSHPELYKQLAAHPDLLPKIKQVEEAINARRLNYVPLIKLAEAEPHLKTGDIVAVCTSDRGIDIAHTGLVIRDAEGVPHFMDASSSKSKMKVTLEPGRISESLRSSKSWIGAMFARPLEPA
jgi:hypothetical protein